MTLRLPHLLAALAAGLLLSVHAFAAGGLSSLMSGKSEFLPVEQAFMPTAELTNPATVRVHWDIADGYYLYRHQLRFSLPDAGGITLGDARIPKGKTKEDDYFGTVEVYHHSLDVELPVSGAIAGTLMLQVRYQGCAEKGLCYPPQTVQLPLVATSSPTLPATGSNTAGTQDLAEQDQLARFIGERNLFWVLLSFFGFGLLLAFTPCVLPMLPILSGIIAGAEGRVGAARGFTLSLSYVMAMALAYTVFGVIAGLTGANLQAAMQNPWVIVGFSALFVVLSLSMFGFYELQLPSALQTRLAGLSNRQKGGSLVGAAVMGFFSALIVGPCLAPPLAGALLYIGNTGNAVLGGLALFALGLGMGLPLIALGVAEGSVLPRAGSWMDSVKHFFGVVMLGVAVWMLGRILPGPVTLGLWAALLLLSAVILVLPERKHGSLVHLLWKAIAVLAAVYGLVLMAAAIRGGSDPLHPLKTLIPEKTDTAQANLQFQSVKTVSDLERALAESSRQRRPALLDFYADWCVACVKMEHEVFPAPAVRAALSGVTLLRADVTANDEEDRALLKQLGVFGPPTILFFGADGSELKDHRLVGERDAPAFALHAREALGR